VTKVSLASRIAVLTACAVGLTVAICSAAAYVAVRSQLHEQTDRALLQRARASAQANDSSKLPPVVAATYLRSFDVHIAVIYSDGSFERPNQDLPILKHPTLDEIAVARGDRADAMRTVRYAGLPYRLVTVPLGGGAALMLLEPQDSIERTLDRLGWVLSFIGGLGIIVAGICGFAVARSALRPVRRLSAAAEHIAATEELTPITITGDDELASLATSFNDMLAALASSRDRQRRLVADAGHELRTPLTSLRTNIELLAQANDRGGMSPPQRNEIISDITAQSEELSTLVGDLVELARDEPLPQTPEQLDLAEVCGRAITRARRRAPSVHFDVRVAPWWVVGESNILERAVLNLLDNAAKWSPPNGTVTVRLAAGVLTVADDGPGIKHDDLPHVFDRFFRAEDARTQPGSGLGLSIVRQAVVRHGGTVAAANTPTGGAQFTMRIPGSPVPMESMPV
jgi:two-component system, OmpR family, sensor histidine kinase MprB